MKVNKERVAEKMTKRGECKQEKGAGENRGDGPLVGLMRTVSAAHPRLSRVMQC